MITELTKEQEIAQNYKAAMDSVNLINELKSKVVLAAEEVDRMKANKDHLVIMLAKDYWTTEDLTPFTLAVGV
jgi:SMC interacting uncharacterized protein involved in chromosome segregation